MANVFRPPIHCLDYADFGSGKTTFADTFPNPKIIWFFDAYGKELPYLKGGEVSELFSDEKADFVRVVTSPKGKLLKRIEYYHDNVFTEPKEVKRKAGISVQDVAPNAYARFLKRMATFQHEYDEWATGVVDSVTTMEICARRWDQFVLNPHAEDSRQWYGASKDLLERMLLGRMANLPMNIVVLAHIDDEKFEHQGTQRRMPMAPGKLRGSLPSQYSEVYRQYVDKEGEYLLQTTSDGVWACTTTIGAPNPCAPHYQALWANRE
jgi:hypothetical protein